jgi:hypothetical protein
MPFLRILCAVKNKSFATSVEISVEHKASLPNMIKFSYCPYCYALHGWTPDEAFFDDAEYEASQYEAGNAAANASRRPKDKPQQLTAGASSRNGIAGGRLR